MNVNAIHLDGGGTLWVVDTGSSEFGGNPIPGSAKLVKIDLATNAVRVRGSDGAITAVVEDSWLH